MSQTVGLCLDEDSFRHPEYVGLEGESFEQQSWLKVFDSGVQARSESQQAADINEFWVVSCNDVEPINLAASLKHDRPDLRVKLVSSEAGGSLRSRATTATIDEVLELSAFVRIYLETKQRAYNEKVSPHATRPLDIPDPRDGSSAQCLKDNLLDIDHPLANDIPLDSSVLKDACPDQGGKPEVSPAQTLQLNITTSAQVDPIQKNKKIGTRAHKGFLLSVVSGSGGSGKSTIAVLAALEAAQKGYRTLLLDYDLQFGDVAYMLRNIPSTNIDQIINSPEQRTQVFTQEAPLVVIGAPERFETSEIIVDKIADFTEEAIQYFDVIIVNTGSNWSEQHALLLERSSVALFLLDQRGSSLRACSHALELCARCGIASIPFKLALNRCSKNAPFSSSEVARIFRDEQVFELKNGGDEVEEHLASGHAFELRGLGNDLVLSIGHMLEQILPQSDSPFESRPSLSARTTQARRRKRRGGKKRSKVAL